MYIYIYIVTPTQNDPPTFVLTVNLQYIPVLLLYLNPTPIWILHILIWAHLSRIFVSSEASAHPMVTWFNHSTGLLLPQRRRPSFQKPQNQPWEEKFLFRSCFWFSLGFPWCFLVSFGENQTKLTCFGFLLLGRPKYPKHTVFII